SIKDALRKQDAKANLLTLKSREKSSRAIEALSRSPERMSFPLFNSPIVSVIIPIYGKVEYTLRCLASIALNLPAVAFEIIVVDDLSPDASLEMLDKIKGIRVLRNEQNQGFLRSCNYGASEARGQYLHFLNNDTEVEAGWLDELLLTFQKEPNAGLVGSKLIYPDGYLQEAGGIIWQDGSAGNWGHRQDPTHSAYNYVRDADYISGASIMVPTEVFHRLGKFNTLYTPAYYEDTDLAMAVRQADLRVVYQPYSRVIHFEGVSSGTDVTQGTKQFQEINRVKFIDKWASELSGLTPNAFEPYLSCDRQKSRHILIIDACTPTPDQDSGSLDMINLIKILVELNWRVHFVPITNFLHFGHYTDVLQRLGVECVYAPYYKTLGSYLQERGDIFELCLMARTDVTSKALPTVKKFCPSAKTIFYTVDLHFLREQREAELKSDQEKLKRAKETERIELGLMEQVDSTVVLSETERDLLIKLGKTNVSAIPLIRDVGTQVSTTVSERCGVLFVGGFQHLPNVDAVDFLLDSIWPEVRNILTARSAPAFPLYIVGSNMPDRFQTFSAPDVIPVGFVSDLSEIFNKIRISIAPLRYGAGLKGKVASSLLFGIPVVGTSMAYEGMSTRGLSEIRFQAETATELAQLIVDLHSSSHQLEQLAGNCRAYAIEHYSRTSIRRSVQALFDSLGIAGAGVP
ncbi:MAG: glycosyltransferase, partial [Aestuariivirga sp.]|uniref:glycosyltransferase n=1 Tax=Aestuariivirga sp. TaxID=2650926 RepID=UPI0030167F26